VCPQGVLFRGQPEVEEETGECDDDGNPVIKRRKADDEHLIRQALLDSGLIDAVVSLPLNVFYGAGVPACLLILSKRRPKVRHDKLLLVYAARHYRELSNQNELRPQDVMRILVHYHAYGDASKVPTLVAEHSGRMRDQISQRELEEVERLEAEYKQHSDRLAKTNAEIAELQTEHAHEIKKAEKAKIETKLAKLDSAKGKLVKKIAERDERVADARRRAEDDRKALAAVGQELGALYGDPDELLKHSRVVPSQEVRDNEFNLNIPRYVDTFDPEPRVEVKDAIEALTAANKNVSTAETNLRALLKEVGYAE
jgi:type I restriction enzyme M protein